MKLLAAHALFLVLGLALAAPARSEDPPARDAFTEILGRAAKADDAARSSLAFEIVGLGGDVIQRSFDELVADARANGEVGGPRAQVLLEVFAHVGPFHWRSVVAPALGAAPDAAILRVVTSVVGRSGVADDVPTLLRVSALDAPGACTRELEDAVRDLLLRDEGGFEVLGSGLPVERPEACEPFVVGVERTLRPRAALTLARWVERHATLRRTSLQHLSRLALHVPKPVHEDVLAVIRPLLERGDSSQLAPLLVCLGRLEDEASIPQFLRWLKEGDRGVRQNALWALQTTTGLRFEEDPRAWNTWWNSESKWWDEESTKTFSMLRRGTKAEKIAALNAIDMRRTGRHRLAAEVAPVLEDRDVDVALAAARELNHLGSFVAAAELASALESPEARLVESAHAALEAIAKRTLPTDAAECRRALGLDF